MKIRFKLKYRVVEYDDLTVCNFVAERFTLYMRHLYQTDDGRYHVGICCHSFDKILN